MAYTAKYAPGGSRTGANRIRLRSRRTRPGRNPARPGSGRAGLFGVLVLAVLTLTGCVTVQLDATVHPDGTLSGTARYGVAKTLADFAGGRDQLLNELKSQGSCDFGSGQGTTKDFDDGTYVGIECAFDKVTMAEFNSGEGGPKLTKIGNEFHLTGTMDLLQTLSDNGNGLLGGGLSPGGGPTPSVLPSLPSGVPTDLSSLLPSGLPTDLSSLLPSGLPTDLSSLLPSGVPTDLSSLLPSLPGSGLPSLDPSSLLRTAKVSLAFTFPGKVKASRGKIDGRKVTFTPNSAGVIDFQTTASAVPARSSGLSTVSWLVLAVVILVLLAAAGLLVRRRRAQAAPAGGYPPAFPYPGEPAHGQPGYGQPAYGQPAYGQPGYGQQYPPTQPYPAGQPYGRPAYPGEPYSGPPPTQQPYPPTQQPYPPTQPYAAPPPSQPDPYEQYPAGSNPWQAPADEPNPWSRPTE
jgi:hypothetical protein